MVMTHLSLALNFSLSRILMSSEETRGESVSSFSISSIPLLWAVGGEGGGGGGEKERGGEDKAHLN